MVVAPMHHYNARGVPYSIPYTPYSSPTSWSSSFLRSKATPTVWWTAPAQIPHPLLQPYLAE